MTSNNYITILGWMTNLDIKGNELLVYAIIHGFSQDNDSYFHGSINYLCKWTKTSEVCMIEVLKKLVDKGLLEKVVRDGRTNLYRTINPFEKNINDVSSVNVENQCNDKKYRKLDNQFDTEVNEIINYLNNKLNSRYRSSNTATKKLIVSKLNSGFTVEDFKIVINNKFNDWFNNQEMSKYLRPTTLFGNKFENYLNQKSCYNNSYTITNSNKEIDRCVEVNTDTIY